MKVSATARVLFSSACLVVSVSKLEHYPSSHHVVRIPEIPSGTFHLT
jgi:hypothetical protein